MSDPVEAKRKETINQRNAILAQIEQDKIERRLKLNRQVTVTVRAPLASVSDLHPPSAHASSSALAAVDSVLASVSDLHPPSAHASSSPLAAVHSVLASVDSVPALFLASASSHPILGGFTTESLPDTLQQFKKNEFKKYRDAVCEVLKLRFKNIGGYGNCFFESVSALLQHSRAVQIGPDHLRQIVVLFLRECFNNQHNIVGERCVMDMEGELGQPMTGGSRKNSGLCPDTVEEYLNVCAIDGVWVQGYHWFRAVAVLFNCCVVVVIHGHEHLYLFGDPDHERFHLYKRDVETHFDALLYEDNAALLALAFAASSNSSSEEVIEIDSDSSNDSSVSVSNQRRRLRSFGNAKATVKIPTIVQPLSRKKLKSAPVVQAQPPAHVDSDSEMSTIVQPLSRKKLKSAPVVQPQPPVSIAVKTFQIPVSNPVPKIVKDVGTKVVQLDDALLVIPPHFAANGRAEANLHLIGLMKGTGHSRAFVRTSKAPPTHSGYWSKVICPECVCFIIGSADVDGKAWSVNSQGHGVCTSIVSSSAVSVSVSRSAGSVVTGSASSKSASVLESFYCFLCRMDHDKISDVAFCSHPISHKFCSDCFDGLVKHNVTGLEKAAFIKSKCILRCPTTGCNHNIDLRVCAPYMGAKTHHLYLSCFSEMQVVHVQKQCDERIKAALANIASGAIDDLQTYVEHIAHELVTARCPTLDCKQLVDSFEACSALQCGRTGLSVTSEDINIGGCGAHFCAWCFTICNTKHDCHAHVRSCPFNPAEG